MRRRILAMLFAAVMLFSLIGCSDNGNDADSQENTGVVDYESKINVNQMPLRAVYGRPATNWEEEATPMGNGFIGAMIFGGVDTDRIQVNEHSIWSGGPGADENYNGGMGNTNREQNIANLQAARAELQKVADDFSKNHAAYIKNGNVITSDYPNSATAQMYIDRLKGDKSAYGNYQSLGDIYISEISSVYLADTTVTGCRNLDISPLTDGNTDTKWFSADGGAWGDSSDTVFPVELVFQFSDKVEIEGYSLTSGNDDHDRDPKAWSFSGSDNGKDWTELDARSDMQFAGRLQTEEFIFEGDKPSYKYYKLTILENEGGWGTQLSEVGFIGSGIEKGYSDYERVLDIDNSVTTLSYTKNGVNYEREYFVSNPDNFMAIRISASKENAVNNTIRFATSQPNATISCENDTITITGRPSDHKANIDHLEFAGQLKVVTDGKIESQGKSIAVTDANEIIIYFTAGTNYVQCMDDSFDYFSDEDPLDGVKATIESVSKRDYDELKQAHIEDYQSLYSRFNVDIGLEEVPDITTDMLLTKYRYDALTPSDARYLEVLYYQFGRYLLIASSREGSLPANLQGIWADGLYPPWSADYHTNINVQMNYWLAQQTNLAECHLPMITYINSLVERGKITAELYHCTEDGEPVRGWTTYHENNLWGNTGPAVSEAFYFPTAAAWCCQDIWEYYQFTQDKEFLKENFDTIFGAAIFWVDNLVTDTRDGSLVSSPSWSPEHGPYSIGASCDQGIIWEVFDFTIKAAEILGIESSEIEEIRKAQKKLWMPEIGLNGEYLEWKDENTLDITGDYGHRHVNHLFTLHPGTNVVAGRSNQDDKYVEAMKKVLEIRGDGGTGWSKAWKINFWARLRDGNHAGVMVNQILKESTYKNLFDAHPPFQIDGNFGATAGMTEMIIQSQGDSVDLLPALPDIWANGAISGVRARGNIEVNMEWKNSKVTVAELTTYSGGEVKVSAEGIKNAELTDAFGNKIKFKVDKNGKAVFEASEGMTYIFTFK